MVSLKHDNMVSFQTRCGKAIEQFLKEHSKGSLSTERAYKGDIKRFLKHVYEKTIDTITKEELEIFDYEVFSQYLYTFKNVKNTTVNRHMSTIKSLYTDLVSKRVIDLDVVFLQNVKSLKDDSEEIEPMTIEVVHQFMQEASKERFNADKKRLLIYLAADQGIRLDALLNLTWRQFLPKEDGVYVKGVDKGNKKFEKGISYKVFDELLSLKKENEKSTDKVFAPLTSKVVVDMMDNIKKRLGYEDRNYSFHSFRKTAITHYHRENGGDVFKTQRFAGHADPNTTQKYVNADEIGVTGIFSTANKDKEAYKKLSHEELLEVIENMSYDFIHVLNSKVQQKIKK